MEHKNALSTLQRILAAIQHFGAASIREVAAFCGQSIPNVTRYIDRMLEEHMLCEQTASVAATGRKPKVYSLNPEYGYIVGVEFGLYAAARVGVFSLGGSMILNEKIVFKHGDSAEDTIEDIMSEMETIFAHDHIPRDKIRQIIIANPGIVDAETGAMTLAARGATWAELPLRTMFAERFDACVEVINDINLSAIGEKEYGAGKGYQNFAFIRMDTGLASGIILKNRLYQGENKAAGEIGFARVPVVKNGKVEYVQAESIMTVPMLCEDIGKRLADHPNDLFYSVTCGDVQNVTVENIVKVLGTNSYVNECVREFSVRFGYLLANMVATLDVMLVVIGGDIVKFDNYFFKPVRNVLAETLPFPPTLGPSFLGDDVALLGAFSVGIEKFLQNIS